MDVINFIRKISDVFNNCDNLSSVNDNDNKKDLIILKL